MYAKLHMNGGYHAPCPQNPQNHQTNKTHTHTHKSWMLSTYSVLTSLLLCTLIVHDLHQDYYTTIINIRRTKTRHQHHAQWRWNFPEFNTILHYKILWSRHAISSTVYIAIMINQVRVCALIMRIQRLVLHTRRGPSHQDEWRYVKGDNDIPWPWEVGKHHNSTA